MQRLSEQHQTQNSKLAGLLPSWELHYQCFFTPGRGADILKRTHVNYGRKGRMGELAFGSPDTSQRGGPIAGPNPESR